MGPGTGRARWPGQERQAWRGEGLWPDRGSDRLTDGERQGETERERQGRESVPEGQARGHRHGFCSGLGFLFRTTGKGLTGTR